MDGLRQALMDELVASPPQKDSMLKRSKVSSLPWSYRPKTIFSLLRRRAMYFMSNKAATKVAMALITVPMTLIDSPRMSDKKA